MAADGDGTQGEGERQRAGGRGSQGEGEAQQGRLGETPSQTLGPYFSMRLAADGENALADDATPGERIAVEGRVLDGDRAPIEDALIEVWQANADGRYRHPGDTRDDVPLHDGFTGFGRAQSAFETGAYRFDTVRPGPVPDADGRPQAPHLNLIVQARGMLLPTFTRVYFSDEVDANAADAVLSAVPDGRRGTLIAQHVEGSRPPTFRFDIVYQGDDETVFFDV